ncbi:unnamed protein product [Rhizoctonia solani]|uniref:NACHT domain-containing protein n=1 Tax=Rhizoctonia solani TaxID=456999 RepID=A0A8H3DJN9_9AGAM|nr:unnamed protein product [Rhizoctonia solani]
MSAKPDPTTHTITMSSSPGSPKQKKGIRQSLEPFSRSRSRSRSPSQLPAQHIQSALSIVIDSNEPIVSVINPIAGASSGNDEAAAISLAGPSPIYSTEGTGSALGTTEFIGAQFTPVPPASIPEAQVQKSQNAAWDGLRGSLRLLRDSPVVFPSLSSAADSLLSCLDELEVNMQNRQDFEDLAIELSTLVQSLKPYTDVGSASILVSNSTTNISMAIERRVTEIKKGLGCTPGSGILGASKNEEEQVGHYRRIQSHFRQLQLNASMSTWSITNQHLANTRLEGLNPVKKATYDSSLSTEINRRGCTEGTRAGVLDGLDKWVDGLLPSPIYWMNGMAGTGKTTIAATFCERIERRKLLAASFFCTRSSAECRNVTRIVPTIAHQLARYSTPFQSALCQVLGQNPDIGSKNTSGQFEQLLKGPLLQVKDAIPGNLVVVIDALDECDDRNGVELMLDVLFRYAAQVPLKFLVTSRPEQEIYGKMSAHVRSREVLHLHDIEKSLVRADIELYLKEELSVISPGHDEIERLAQRSGTLFIYAATLVRYISGKRSIDPQKRLRVVLNMELESTKKYAQIDALYAAVLESALNEDGLEADETEDIRAVLWTALLAQEPIGVETIAKLTDINDSQRVVHALQPLRSVLHQSEETGLVSTLHASFPDFMFSEERSGSNFCDIPRHSQLLSRMCSVVMKEQLRFNICDLASSFIPDENVENIQERIKAKISPTLAYACRYWASHFASTPKSDILLQILDEFLCHRLLFWMEVLSLRRELPMGVNELLKAHQWLMLPGLPSPELLLLLDDARSFVTGFAVNSSSNSTPHIYVSSLALCPQSNSVYKHYHKRARGLLELTGSLMERREAAPLATWTVSSAIISLALSPDGTRVAIGCLDNTVSILSAYDGTVHVGPLEGHPNDVLSVAFSPDGGRLVSASLGSIRVWNSYNGIRVSGTFKGHMRHINSVSFSPDGARVVSAGHDSTIRVWNAYDGAPLLDPLTDHTDLVLRVAFSPNGDLLASASADRTVRLWHSHNGTPAAPPLRGHAGAVHSLAFTPDGTRLVSAAGDKTIRVWDIFDGSLVNNSFEGYADGIRALAISPNSKRIAAGCNDDAVRVWNIDDGKLVAGPFFGHTDSVKSVAYSPDGTRVFSGSSDRTIRVWNVRDGVLPPPPLPPQKAIAEIRTVIFCPDSRHFLSSGGPSVLRIWDTADGSFITTPEEANFFPTPISILSPDGSYIASTSKNGMVQISRTTNGALVAGPLEVERSSLSAFWFSHNSKAIIMGCQDGMIKVCSLQSETVTLGSFKGHHRGVSSLAESPDCSLLVSYSDFEFALRVWDVVTPALDLKLFNNASHDSTSGHINAAFYDGWNITEDGWVVNKDQHLLFWLPPDVASTWCSPYATLVVTKFGTLQVPKQKPLIGDQWVKCYLTEAL